MYKPTYAKKIDSIYFDLEHDCNDEINAWFDFILNRANDAIFYHMSKISNLEWFSNNNILKMEKVERKIDSDSVSKMNIQKIKR